MKSLFWQLVTCFSRLHRFFKFKLLSPHIKDGFFPWCHLLPFSLMHPRLPQGYINSQQQFLFTWLSTFYLQYPFFMATGLLSNQSKFREYPMLFHHLASQGWKETLFQEPACPPPHTTDFYPCRAAVDTVITSWSVIEKLLPEVCGDPSQSPPSPSGNFHGYFCRDFAYLPL